MRGAKKGKEYNDMYTKEYLFVTHNIYQHIDIDIMIQNIHSNVMCIDIENVA